MLAAMVSRPADQAAAAFFDAVLRHASMFDVDALRSGFDVLCRTADASLPSRARLKGFSPRAGTFVVFLYKDSNVPFSDDRFSYGALVAKGDAPDVEDLRAVLDYAATGFNPEHRPACAKRTIPFTVPR